MVQKQLIMVAMRLSMQLKNQKRNNRKNFWKRKKQNKTFQGSSLHHQPNLSEAPDQDFYKKSNKKI